jgi:hypothetical protein
MTKRVLLAASAAIALVCSGARAQTPTVPYAGVSPTAVTGPLVLLNDTVGTALTGSQWATAKFVVGTAGTAVVTPEVSIDGGTNYFASAYAKQIGTVASNPIVAQILGTVAAGASWEVPLPANATNFRLRCAVGGTATTVTVSGSQPYAPGAPVHAVLYDTTSAVNTALDTGTLDMSGWQLASVHYTTPAGGSGTISEVDDAGTSVAIETVPASANSFATFSAIPAFNVTAVALPAAGFFGSAPLLRRMRFQSAPVAALTSRIRIEVRR